MSGLSNNSDVIVLVNLEVKTLEDPLVATSWISEPDILELDFASEYLGVNLLLALGISLDINPGWGVDDSEDLKGGLGGIAHVWSHGGSLGCSEGAKHESEDGDEHVARIAVLIVGILVCEFTNDKIENGEDAVVDGNGETHGNSIQDSWLGSGGGISQYNIPELAEQNLVVTEGGNSLVVLDSVRLEHLALLLISAQLEVIGALLLLHVHHVLLIGLLLDNSTDEDERGDGDADEEHWP